MNIYPTVCTCTCTCILYRVLTVGSGLMVCAEGKVES